MKNQDILFQIGEVTKILGVTRKTLLVYEEAGLLTPAIKDKNSGYRYYTADNMTQIQSIRTLQSLGLSLKEIGEYYYSTKNIDIHLERLIQLRAILDKNIQRLQLRSTKQGDMTIHNTVLPHQVCYCRRYHCKDTSEAAVLLRKTFNEAAHTGKMDKILRMFCINLNISPDGRDHLYCIPVVKSFDGPERTEFPETPALCIYHRGSYEGIPNTIKVLSKYIEEQGIEAAGHPRSIFMEGPPSRGSNVADYITQVAIPIKNI